MLFTALLIGFSVSLATLGFFLFTFFLATFATGVGVILGTVFTGCNSPSFGTPVATSPINSVPEVVDDTSTNVKALLGENDF